MPACPPAIGRTNRQWPIKRSLPPHLVPLAPLTSSFSASTCRVESTSLPHTRHLHDHDAHQHLSTCINCTRFRDTMPSTSSWRSCLSARLADFNRHDSESEQQQSTVVAFMRRANKPQSMAGGRSSIRLARGHGHRRAVKHTRYDSRLERFANVNCTRQVFGACIQQVELRHGMIPSPHLARL